MAQIPYSRMSGRMRAQFRQAARSGSMAGFDGFLDDTVSSLKDTYNRTTAVLSEKTTAYDPKATAELLIASAAALESIHAPLGNAWAMAVERKYPVVVLDKLTAQVQKFNARANQVNYLTHQLQMQVKAKTGKHVAMPIVNPIGSTEAVTYAGYDAIQFAPIAIFLAGVKFAVDYVKKVRDEAKKDKQFAEDTNNLLTIIVNDPALSAQEKADLYTKVTGAQAAAEAAEEGKPGFFSKIADSIKGKFGLTAATQNIARTIKWGALGAGAIAGTVIYLDYRKRKGKGGGMGAWEVPTGFAGESQQEKFTRATQLCKGKPGYRECMSRVLTGGEP